MPTVDLDSPCRGLEKAPTAPGPPRAFFVYAMKSASGTGAAGSIFWFVYALKRRQRHRGRREHPQQAPSTVTHWRPTRIYSREHPQQAPSTLFGLSMPGKGAIGTGSGPSPLSRQAFVPGLSAELTAAASAPPAGGQRRAGDDDGLRGAEYSGTGYEGILDGTH